MSINQTPLNLPRTNKTMMKLALLGLFCLETSLAGKLTKAQLEDWEVRPDLQYSGRTSVCSTSMETVN